MKKGRAGTMTHDKCNGTTTLFAALNVLEGKVIGRCMQRHRHQEFIDAEVTGEKSIHVVIDNYATHKHPEVLAQLARHKRFTFHFTPTSCSWLNAVEGYFAKLSRRRLKRGVFKSVADLQAAINVNNVSLSQNTLDVNLHGCLRDSEVLGYHLVGLAIGQASEDLDLSARQVAVRWHRIADIRVAKVGGKHRKQ
jgi:hypothetical protein